MGGKKGIEAGWGMLVDQEEKGRGEIIRQRGALQVNRVVIRCEDVRVVARAVSSTPKPLVFEISRLKRTGGQADSVALMGGRDCAGGDGIVVDYRERAARDMKPLSHTPIHRPSPLRLHHR